MQIFIFLFLILFPFSSMASSYRNIQLPYGISVEVPLGWVILNKSITRQLDNSIEATYGFDQSNNEILFAANCYTNNDKRAAATFRISIRHKTPDFSQNDLKIIDEADLDEYKKEIINVLKKINNIHQCKINFRNIQVRINTINTLLCLEIIKEEYCKNYTKIAITNILPLDNSLAKITYSFESEQRNLLFPIINKMVKSIKFNNN